MVWAECSFDDNKINRYSFIPISWGGNSDKADNWRPKPDAHREHKRNFLFFFRLAVHQQFISSSIRITDAHSIGEAHEHASDGIECLRSRRRKMWNGSRSKWLPYRSNQRSSVEQHSLLYFSTSAAVVVALASFSSSDYWMSRQQQLWSLMIAKRAFQEIFDYFLRHLFTLKRYDGLTTIPKHTFRN